LFSLSGNIQLDELTFTHFPLLPLVVWLFHTYLLRLFPRYSRKSSYDSQNE
jgi:hypothetical protein